MVSKRINLTKHYLLTVKHYTIWPVCLGNPIRLFSFGVCAFVSLPSFPGRKTKYYVSLLNVIHTPAFPFLQFIGVGRYCSFPTINNNDKKIINEVLTRTLNSRQRI